MVNSQMISEVTDAFKLDSRVDKIPQVIPVCEVNPKITKSVQLAYITGATVTGTQQILASTIYPNAEVYIKSVHLSYAKDVLCDIATGNIAITCTMNGTTRTIVSLPVITLTAQQQSIALTFENPIHIDKATSINLSGAYAAGTMVRTAGITLILDEVN